MAANTAKGIGLIEFQNSRLFIVISLKIDKRNTGRYNSIAIDVYLAVLISNPVEQPHKTPSEMVIAYNVVIKMYSLFLPPDTKTEFAITSTG